MSSTFSCRCQNPNPVSLGLDGCAHCGGERLQSSVVWSEDAAESKRPPPRTEAPRHAEQAAQQLYQRVASRPSAPRSGRFHGRSILIGLVLFGAAGVVYHFDWDVALLRLVSIMLAFCGLISFLKGLLGYGPSR